MKESIGVIGLERVLERKILLKTWYFLYARVSLDPVHDRGTGPFKLGVDLQPSSGRGIEDCIEHITGTSTTIS